MLYEDLTVNETLTYAALLRLPQVRGLPALYWRMLLALIGLHAHLSSAALAAGELPLFSIALAMQRNCQLFATLSIHKSMARALGRVDAGIDAGPDTQASLTHSTHTHTHQKTTNQ